MTDKIGPTGEFPLGKLNEHDEGELNMAIGNEDGKVFVNFGTPVASLGMTPAEAVRIAEGLIKSARDAARHTGEIVTVRL